MAVKCLWLLGPLLMLFAALLSSLLPPHGPPHVNYDASVYFDHAHLKLPSSKDDIVEIVQTARTKGQKVRVVGSGHSWSAIAASDDVLVSLWNLTGIVSVDRDSMQVTVRAGTPLKMLNQHLDKEGLAMQNLGSISEQTAAGAISTGTHGTGIEFQNLAAMVTKLELVNGKGELLSLTPEINPDLFKAAQVSVGMLGIITEVTFQCERKFNLIETTTLHNIEYCLNNFMNVMNSAQHVKLWLELYSDTCAVLAANRTTETPRNNPITVLKNLQMVGFEGLLLLTSWFPILTPYLMKVIFGAVAINSQTRVDTSYDVFNIPHWFPVHPEHEMVVELQSCPLAIHTLWDVIKEYNIPLNYITEIRSVKGDDIWLSPDYHRNACHITQLLYNPSQHTQSTYFYQSSIALTAEGLQPRPHWGKSLTRLAEEGKSLSSVDKKGVGQFGVEEMFPKLGDFMRVRSDMDPQAIFMNDLLKSIFKELA